jgi:hypothetical protein
LGVADWYYIANKRQLGPVTFEALEELAGTGKLRAADLVWHEGMTTWERAGTQGLCAAAKVGEPATDARPINRTNHDPREHEPRDDGMPVGAKVGLLVGLGVLLLIVVGLSLYFFMRSDGAFEVAAAGNVIPGFLELDAPPDEVRGTPCHIHTVRLVRGRTYHIDLQSDQPGFVLRLENSDSVEIAHAENNAEAGRAHMVFRCPRVGVYRVIVTNQFRGPYTLHVCEP